MAELAMFAGFFVILAIAWWDFYRVHRRTKKIAKRTAKENKA